jgi:hypothetical protein
MIQFIFTDIFMLSLGAVLYLMVRALPRIAEEPSEKKNFLDRWAHSDIPEKMDTALNGFLLKFLRKVKILVLKVDNALSKELRKIKSEENGAKPAIDFKEILGQSADEKEASSEDAGDQGSNL